MPQLERILDGEAVVKMIANLFVVGITVFLLTYYVFGRPLRYTFVVVAIGIVSTGQMTTGEEIQTEALPAIWLC